MLHPRRRLNVLLPSYQFDMLEDYARQYDMSVPGALRKMLDDHIDLVRETVLNQTLEKRIDKKLDKLAERILNGVKKSS